MVASLFEALAAALKPERPVRIVDVGANPMHEPPYGDLLAAGCAEVVGFEPQAAAFAVLQADKPAHATYVNAAVGAGGTGTLHWWPQAPGMASLYPFRARSARYLGRFRGLAGTAEEIVLDTKTLDELAEVPDIDLLKIDVQGAERDIIRAGREKLKGAVAVITEMRFYQLYRGEPPLGQLDLELRRQGFILHKFLPMARTMLPSRYAGRLSKTARSQIIDGDAVYIRPLETPEDWETEALKRLALLAAGAFGSYDLALMVLAELEDRGAVARAEIDAFIAALPKTARAA